MPSAPTDLQDLMTRWFGSIDLYGPLALLHSHGYRERAGMIILPTPAHTVSHDEDKCIDFLFQEWDFGYDPDLKE